MVGFRFGTDAVLLAHFAEPKKNEKVVDLGTGTGIIPLVMSAKADIKEIIGIELDKDTSEMAKRSVALNQSEEKINIINADLRSLHGILPKGEFDLVTCNPPYKAEGSGLINQKEDIKNARFETTCTLEDVIKTSSELLRFGGRLCMVHKPERLSDIIVLMRKYKIEAKRLHFVIPNINKEPSLILIEGKRGAKSGIRIKQLIIDS
jgi:tRNA1(Val) A37 N6-methylase TrmN6